MASPQGAHVTFGGEGQPARVRWTPALIRVIAALNIALFVAAVDTTIVSTALPTITGEFGGFSLYAWIFSGYLVTSTTTIPLWGRASDIVGRRPVLIAGVGGFVVTSALCAASFSMLSLVIFRTLQGLAAGAVVSTALTIASDVLPPRQRTRVQALISATSGVAAMLGPLLGAIFVFTIGWRWIFLINLPLGAISVLFLLGYRELRPPRVAEDRIDFRGVTLLTLGISALLIGLGTGNANAEPVPLALAAAVALLVAFAVVELRSRYPTVPLRLISHRVIGPLLLVGLFQGMIQYGIPPYGALYVQEGLGGNAFAAGAVVIPSSAAMTIASSVGTWVMLRFGYQRLVLIGAAFLTAGALMLYLGPARWGIAWVSVCMGALGLGMGVFVPPVTLTIQASVQWGSRGAATALNLLTRSLGGAIGVAVMGVVVQSFVSRAPRIGAGNSAVWQGLHQSFLVFLVAGIATLATGLWITARRTGERPTLT